MRALKIDFVESALPRLLWRGVAVLFVLSLFLAAFLELHARKEFKEIRATQHTLKSQIAAAEGARQPAAAGQPARLLLAEQLLVHDWNQLFSFLESIELPGSRLVSLQSGVAPNKTRVEYRVDSWAEVVSLNEQLNMDPQRRWELVSVTSADRSGSEALTGIWEH
ncbi:MAG: hypothetical protein MUF76_03910 [Hydrogenophaga sp.]|jgi:hypothetical protein|nr:hypothetical protein [Hydrogenophaga sp.]